ncbi:hypothetical protein [Microbacterium sp.]|uniref:hypothetical protein n=1 Tax=Microbacterium sp. TaxID=51671 RepID=UPI003A854F67
MTALGAVSGPDDGVIDFSDAAALRELSGGELLNEWGLVRMRGFGPLADNWRLLPDSLGIDPEAVDYAITVGASLNRVTTLVGGQDESAVRTAAQAAGWSDGDVLRHDLDGEQQLTMLYGWIAPEGDTVVFGGRQAETGGDPASDDPDVHAIAACLGDVVAAFFMPSAAVGLLPVGGDEAVSVYCVLGDEAAAASIEHELATGVSAFSGRAYAELFPEQTVAESDGVVRVELSAGPGPLDTVIQMLRRGELPAG